MSSLPAWEGEEAPEHAPDLVVSSRYRQLVSHVRRNREHKRLPATVDVIRINQMVIFMFAVARVVGLHVQLLDPLEARLRRSSTI